MIFTICAVRHINLAHDWAWLNMPSSDNKDEDASVAVKITVYPGGILWDLECKQNNAVVLQNCGMSLDCHTWQPSILACLKQSRKSFFLPPHRTNRNPGSAVLSARMARAIPAMALFRGMR